MKPFAIAIVGFGKIARDQHVASLRAHDRFEIVAAVDPHHGLEGTPRFVDLDAMLASDVRVDAVAICTPPQARSRIAHAAIAAGQHIPFEKPPTTTLAELADLARRAESAGLTLFAAWHSRFAPMIEPARVAGRPHHHARAYPLARGRPPLESRPGLAVGTPAGSAWSIPVSTPFQS